MRRVVSGDCVGLGMRRCESTVVVAMIVILLVLLLVVACLLVSFLLLLYVISFGHLASQIFSCFDTLTSSIATKKVLDGGLTFYCMSLVGQESHVV